MIQVVSKIYVLILSGVLLSFNISAQKIIVKASVPDQSLMLGRFYNGHEYLVDSFAVKNGKAVLLSGKLFRDGYYNFYFTKSEGGADYIISGDCEFTIKISKDLKQVRYKGSKHNDCIFNNRQCNAESGSFAEAFKKNTELYKRCSGRPDSLEWFFTDFDYSSDFRLHPVFFSYLRRLEIEKEGTFVKVFENILAKLMTDEQKEYLFRYFISSSPCGMPDCWCYLPENHIELIQDKNSDLYFKLKRRREKLCE